MLHRRLGIPSTESLFVAALVLFGFRVGAHPISDNSMLTHLRTGVDIARGLGIPRHDPYSFTAAGKPWVVQSWLAESIYGWLYRVAGMHLVMLGQAALTGLLAWLVVRLAKAGTPLRTALAGATAMGVGVAYWSQRPLLFGLLAFALLITVVDHRRNPWLLLAVGWFWVNSHGSFPLGLAWVGAFAVGRYLDDRSADGFRYVGTFIAGLLVGAVNPLGPRLLTFAVAVGEKREVFRSIAEWHSPNFQDLSGLFTLAFLVVAFLLISRRGLRWSDVLPVMLFVALALIAVRNMPMLGVALAPALGRALRPTSVATRDVRRAAANVAFLAVIAVAGLLFAASALAQPAVDVSSYPVASVAYLQREGLLGRDHRIAHQDVVGNYLTYRFGRRVRVFIDDRYDMYPTSVSDDYATLLHADDGARAVLDRWHIDTVLWDRSLPLVTLLRETGAWRQVDRKGAWVVLRRNSS